MKTIFCFLLSAFCISAQTLNVTTANVGTLTKAAAAPGGGFDPSTVSGYALDYDVDAMGLANGTAISPLNDGGPWKYHLRTNGVSYPGPYSTNNGSVINSKRWAFFDGSVYLQTNFSATLAQPTTVFLVAKIDPKSDPNYIFDGGSSGDYRQYFGWISGWRINAGSSMAASDYQILTNKWYLFEFHYRSIVSQYTSSIFTNGVEVVSNDAGNDGLHGFTLGTRFDGNPAGYSSPSSVARLMLFTNDLAGADLTNLRNYCATNYLLWTP